MIPNGLFYVSRAISRDAFNVFYSINAFTVCNRSEFALLGSLSAIALVSLAETCITFGDIDNARKGQKEKSSTICQHNSMNSSSFATHVYLRNGMSVIGLRSI